MIISFFKSRKAYLALRQSEQHFRSLLENVPGAVYEYIFRKDGNMGFKWLSPSIEKIFGISPEIFMKSLDFIHPDDKEPLLRAYKFSQETKKPFYFEGRIITPDGKLKWYSASSSFSYSTADGSNVFTGILLDVTERKKAEEDTSKKESRFRLMLQKMGEYAWEHDFLEDETIFSEKIYELIGNTAGDLKNNIKIWWNCIHPDDKWMVLENNKKYKTGQLECHSLEYRIYHSNGSPKWVLDRGMVVERTGNGLAAKIFGTFLDITKEKELQERLLTQEREKKKEIMQAVIEAQEREREEIAHELNDNINQNLSYCNLKLNEALDNKINYKEVLRNVLENINQVINEVRSICYGLNNSTLQLIGLHEAVNDLVYRVNLTGKIKIGINTNDSELAKKIDHGVSLTLFRIIQEQIANILKHAEASTADIRLAITEEEISVTINDNGKGFDPNIAKKGLGLINIINRVEHFNGSISLDTKPGKGCSLKATIPFIAVERNL